MRMRPSSCKPACLSPSLCTADVNINGIETSNVCISLPTVSGERAADQQAVLCASQVQAGSRCSRTAWHRLHTLMRCQSTVTMRCRGAHLRLAGHGGLLRHHKHVRPAGSGRCTHLCLVLPGRCTHLCMVLPAPPGPCSRRRAAALQPPRRRPNHNRCTSQGRADAGPGSHAAAVGPHRVVSTGSHGAALKPLC